MLQAEQLLELIDHLIQAKHIYLMGKKFKKSVLWLRRDLRLQDNMAAAKASKDSDSVQVVFCFDQNIISKLKKRG